MGFQSRIVVDTSAYSRLRVGHQGVIRLFCQASVVLVPVVVLGELWAGFLLGRRYDDNKHMLEEFLAEPFVDVVPTSADIAHHYGRLFAALRRAGSPIPTNDIWIAATTIDAGAQLVTFDNDFARVAGLDCTILE